VARWIISWILLLSASPFVGCNSDTGNKNAAKPPATADQKLRIAVVPKGTTHIFWKSVHAGAEKAAEELGNVEIIWKAQLHEDDTEGQINVVESFIVQQVDGIVLAPLDRQGLVKVVRKAKEAGIPTVIFDSALDDADNTLSYVATDNYNGGVLGARTLAEQLGGKGNVILLRYRPGSESTEQREQGFIETIKKEFPGIHEIAAGQYAGTTPESALDKTLELLNQHGDKVNGMFAVCEPVATGALAGLKQEGLAGKVKLIGFDPSPGMVQALVDGNMDGIVLQDPVNMGYEGVKTMVNHLRGKEIQKRVNTGEAIATRENMKTAKIDDLLHPAQAD
jgi:ribose transport system substrate-binding protein